MKYFVTWTRRIYGPSSLGCSSQVVSTTHGITEFVSRCGANKFCESFSRATDDFCVFEAKLLGCQEPPACCVLGRIEKLLETMLSRWK